MSTQVMIMTINYAAPWHSTPAVCAHKLLYTETLFEFQKKWEDGILFYLKMAIGLVSLCL